MVLKLSKYLYGIWHGIWAAARSCACTTFLCMHSTLVHALGQGIKAPGTKPEARNRAWDPKRQLGRSQARDCTRVLCMHKNQVHAQES